MFKFLDASGVTYHAGKEYVYPLPRPGERWGPWLEHPEPAEPDGRVCGPGRWHLMKYPTACYASSTNWWPWWAEGRELVDEDREKASFHAVRLRRISPHVWWRIIRLGWCSGEYLRGANLEGANLEGANLRDANLRSANLEGANLEGANLEGANLRNANLWSANLEGANLEGANLEGANLEGANLENASLRNASLEGANLRGAHLEGANLEGASLEGANLEGASLRGEIYHVLRR